MTIYVFLVMLIQIMSIYVVVVVFSSQSNTDPEDKLYGNSPPIKLSTDNIVNGKSAITL